MQEVQEIEQVNPPALEVKRVEGILHAYPLFAQSSLVDRPEYSESEGGDTD